MKIHTILIVDDSLPMRGIIKKTLRAAGFGGSVLMEAANGQEALDRLAQKPVDLVITDFTMPVMDGYQLISAMKRNPALAGIPAIMITSEGSRERIDQFREKGAAGYIHKPFSPEQLRDLMTTILGEPDRDEGSDEPDSRCDF